MDCATETPDQDRLQPLRQFQEPYAYRVEIAPALHELAAQVDRTTIPCHSD